MLSPEQLQSLRAPTPLPNADANLPASNQDVQNLISSFSNTQGTKGTQGQGNFAGSSGDTSTMDWGKVFNDAVQNYATVPGKIAQDVTQKPTFPGENILAGAADVGSTIFGAPAVSAAAKEFTNTFSKSIEKNPALLQSPIMGKVADFVNNSNNELTKIAQDHPHLISGIANALTIILSAFGAESLNTDIPNPVPAIKDAVGNVAQKGTEVAQGLAEKGGEVTGQVLEKAGITKPAPTEEGVVGRITQQANPYKVGQATRALSGIDYTGVKTFNDLSGKLDEQIGANTKTVDESFAKSDETYKTSDLNQKTNVNGKTVKQNFVKDAVTQLKELYAKTNDAVSLEKMNQLEAKMKTNGLTAKEVNDLARQYGNEFGTKAFSKNGDPLTSVNAQAYENTRTGVKETARSLAPDENTKVIDKQTSDMIETKKMMDKLDQKVKIAQNKLRSSNVFQKIAGGVGKLTDLVTGGTVKSFIKGLGLGVPGAKYNDIIELQGQLQKSLNLLDEINSMKPADAVKEIQSLQNNATGDVKGNTFTNTSGGGTEVPKPEGYSDAQWSDKNFLTGEVKKLDTQISKMQDEGNLSDNNAKQQQSLLKARLKEIGQ